MAPFAKSYSKRKRRILYALLFILMIWQAASFLAAPIVTALNVGMHLPHMETAEYPENLLNPSDDRWTAAWATISEALREYDEHLDRLRQEHGYICRGFVEHSEWMKRLPCDARQDFRLGPDRLYSWHEDVVEYALSAAESGFFDELVMQHLVQLSARSDHQAADWQQILRFARVIGFVSLARYQEASTLLGEPKPKPGSREEAVQELLRSLAQCPDDFRVQVSLANAVAEMPYCSRFTRARAGLYRRAYDSATNDIERTEAIIRFAAHWVGPGQGVSRQGLREAAAVVLAKCEGPRPLLADNFAAMADAYAATLQNRRAVSLFRLVTQQFPGTPVWGRCVFNEGYILRRMGYPSASIAAFSQIFPSGVNEHDPGPNIMEAYRNYRHRAAQEISGAYADIFDFPRSYYWMYLSSTRYPYQSWCGTCRWSTERKLAIQLLNASLKAGPMFVAGNLLLNPLRNLKLWLTLGVGVLVLRTALRRFRKRA